jgi:pyruvate carboxylase
VFQHEIPGGQYSNLRPQASSLGLLDKFEEVKQRFADVNDMFGDIVKVTPSSKVVGDMALFMVSNGLTPADVLEKGETSELPRIGARAVPRRHRASPRAAGLRNCKS